MHAKCWGVGRQCSEAMQASLLQSFHWHCCIGLHQVSIDVSMSIPAPLALICSANHRYTCPPQAQCLSFKSLHGPGRDCIRRPPSQFRICAPQAELKMQGVNNVRVNNLSPGMVTTELLLSGAHFTV